MYNGSCSRALGGSRRVSGVGGGRTDQEAKWLQPTVRLLRSGSEVYLHSTYNGGQPVGDWRRGLQPSSLLVSASSSDARDEDETRSEDPLLQNHFKSKLVSLAICKLKMSYFCTTGRGRQSVSSICFFHKRTNNLAHCKICDLVHTLDLLKFCNYVLFLCSSMQWRCCFSPESGTRK